MAILLQAVDVRHERRLRLVFTNTLASGAFGAPAPAFYTVTNVDGRGPSPTVQAALIVPGSSSVVELVLQQALVKGASYIVEAVSVPATDLSVTPGGSSESFRWGISAPPENVEPIARDRERLLYFTDLLWNGRDFQETANGDLDRVSGTANVTKALQNAAVAGPLAWDPTFGGRLREHVDSPSAGAGTMKGALTQQLLRDPRVASLKVTLETDEDKTYLYVDPKLISGQTADRVTVEVPS